MEIKCTDPGPLSLLAILLVFVLDIKFQLLGYLWVIMNGSSEHNIIDV